MLATLRLAGSPGGVGRGPVPEPFRAPDYHEHPVPERPDRPIRQVPRISTSRAARRSRGRKSCSTPRLLPRGGGTACGLEGEPAAAMTSRSACSSAARSCCERNLSARWSAGGRVWVGIYLKPEPRTRTCADWPPRPPAAGGDIVGGHPRRSHEAFPRVFPTSPISSRLAEERSGCVKIGLVTGTRGESLARRWSKRYEVTLVEDDGSGGPARDDFAVVRSVGLALVEGAGGRRSHIASVIRLTAYLHTRDRVMRMVGATEFNPRPLYVAGCAGGSAAAASGALSRHRAVIARSSLLFSPS